MYSKKIDMILEKSTFYIFLSGNFIFTLLLLKLVHCISLNWTKYLISFIYLTIGKFFFLFSKTNNQIVTKWGRHLHVLDSKLAFKHGYDFFSTIRWEIQTLNFMIINICDMLVEWCSFWHVNMKIIEGKFCCALFLFLFKRKLLF